MNLQFYFAKSQRKNVFYCLNESFEIEYSVRKNPKLITLAARNETAKIFPAARALKVGRLKFTDF